MSDVENDRLVYNDFPEVYKRSEHGAFVTIINAIDHVITTVITTIDDVIKKNKLITARGDELDYIGEILGEGAYRKENESDEEYRSRLLLYVINYPSRSTREVIEAELLDILGYNATIKEYTTEEEIEYAKAKFGLRTGYGIFSIDLPLNYLQYANAIRVRVDRVKAAGVAFFINHLQEYFLQFEETALVDVLLTPSMTGFWSEELLEKESTWGRGTWGSMKWGGGAYWITDTLEAYLSIPTFDETFDILNDYLTNIRLSEGLFTETGTTVTDITLTDIGVSFLEEFGSSTFGHSIFGVDYFGGGAVFVDTLEISGFIPQIDESVGLSDNGFTEIDIAGPLLDSTVSITTDKDFTATRLFHEIYGNALFGQGYFGLTTFGAGNPFVDNLTFSATLGYSETILVSAIYDTFLDPIGTTEFTETVTPISDSLIDLAFDPDYVTITLVDSIIYAMTMNVAEAIPLTEDYSGFIDYPFSESLTLSSDLFNVGISFELMCSYSTFGNITFGKAIFGSGSIAFDYLTFDMTGNFSETIVVSAIVDIITETQLYGEFEDSVDILTDILTGEILGNVADSLSSIIDNLYNLKIILSDTESVSLTDDFSGYILYYGFETVSIVDDLYSIDISFHELYDESIFGQAIFGSSFFGKDYPFIDSLTLLEIDFDSTEQVIIPDTDEITKIIIDSLDDNITVFVDSLFDSEIYTNFSESVTTLIDIIEYASSGEFSESIGLTSDFSGSIYYPNTETITSFVDDLYGITIHLTLAYDNSVFGQVIFGQSTFGSGLAFYDSLTFDGTLTYSETITASVIGIVLSPSMAGIFADSVIIISDSYTGSSIDIPFDDSVTSFTDLLYEISRPFTDTTSGFVDIYTGVVTGYIDDAVTTITDTQIIGMELRFFNEVFNATIFGQSVFGQATFGRDKVFIDELIIEWTLGQTYATLGRILVGGRLAL